MSLMEKHGKRRQITFRIGPIAWQRLQEVAALFHMKPAEYAKAVLYKNLNVFNEPLDQRRRSWRKKQQQAETEENGELFASQIDANNMDYAS